MLLPSSKSHYEVLGINKTASVDEVAQACLRLGEEFRPDKNTSPEAMARFAEIERAYQVLVDPAQRAAYDRSLDEVGMEAASGMGEPASVTMKVVYSLALLLFASPVVAQVYSALILFRQFPGNPNVLNLILASVTVLISVTIAGVVLYRIAGLARGRFKLESRSQSGWVCHVRRLSVFLMYAGVIVLVTALVARFLTGISAIAFIAAEFRHLAPVGLVLFEFSRLLERELADRSHRL